jgi:hypothetical protein
MSEYLDLIMFAALIGAILLGFPVAFSIAGVAVLFAYLGWALGVMDISLMGATGQRVFGLMTNQVLIAIPLFVLMGAVLEKSRIAEELLDTMGGCSGNCAAAWASRSCWSARCWRPPPASSAPRCRDGADRAADHAANGLRSARGLGHRLHRGHAGTDHPALDAADHPRRRDVERLSAGAVRAGQVRGRSLSVGQFFAAAIVPGLMLVALYLVYILVRACPRPQDMPPADARHCQRPTGARSWPPSCPRCC